MDEQRLFATGTTAPIRRVSADEMEREEPKLRSPDSPRALAAIIEPWIASVCSDGNSDATRLARQIGEDLSQHLRKFGEPRVPKWDIAVLGPVNGMGEDDLSGSYMRVVLTGKRDQREERLISIGAAEVLVGELSGLLHGSREPRPRAAPAGWREAIEAAAKVADAEAKRMREKAAWPENDKPFRGTVEEVYGSEALTAEDIAKAIRSLASGAGI